MIFFSKGSSGRLDVLPGRSRLPRCELDRLGGDARGARDHRIDRAVAHEIELGRDRGVQVLSVLLHDEELHESVLPRDVDRQALLLGIDHILYVHGADHPVDVRVGETHLCRDLRGDLLGHAQGVGEKLLFTESRIERLWRSGRGRCLSRLRRVGLVAIAGGFESSWGKTASSSWTGRRTEGEGPLSGRPAPSRRRTLPDRTCRVRRGPVMRPRPGP